MNSQKSIPLQQKLTSILMDFPNRHWQENELNNFNWSSIRFKWQFVFVCMDKYTTDKKWGVCWQLSMFGCAVLFCCIEIVCLILGLNSSGRRNNCISFSFQRKCLKNWQALLHRRWHMIKLAIDIHYHRDFVQKNVFFATLCSLCSVNCCPFTFWSACFKHFSLTWQKYSLVSFWLGGINRIH